MAQRHVGFGLAPWQWQQVGSRAKKTMGAAHMPSLDPRCALGGPCAWLPPACKWYWHSPPRPLHPHIPVRPHEATTGLTWPDFACWSTPPPPPRHPRRNNTTVRADRNPHSSSTKCTSCGLPGCQERPPRPCAVGPPVPRPALTTELLGPATMMQPPQHDHAHCCNSFAALRHALSPVCHPCAHGAMTCPHCLPGTHTMPPPD